ncbi:MULTISPECIES: glycosyltransferase family 4 protein [unclassified Pseudoxanthomonas]|uniref:glycosyltransferase family 4 protein n=1 Tax=unclassified Pseudoxanthomonas TaxID=2645906 RepID=UPI003076B9C3
MRILVLTKRQYTGKDLLDDRYGRLFEIPAGLAALGHEVRGVALSYRRRDEGWHGGSSVPGMRWWSENALPWGLLRYARALDGATEGWRPDIVWASSDMLHAILAIRWSRERQVPCVLDLYDNYESFGLSKFPGLAQRFRRACRQASGITAVSRTLATYVESEYALNGKVQVVSNGVRRDFSEVRDKAECRASLQLPGDARLIGTAGSITADRGIADLFEAFLSLCVTDDRLWLVHAGPVDDTPGRYQHPRIINLGVLPFERMPWLFSALDVGVVCNRDSSFGRYCFPLKLQEMLASRIPVVAAAVGDVADLLQRHQDCLYTPGDPLQLAGRITTHLAQRKIGHLPPVSTWQDCALQLESVLDKAHSVSSSPESAPA